MIRQVRPADFDRLREIEFAAGLQFRDVGLAFIADFPLPPDDYLRDFLGRSWVAETGRVGGYLLAEEIGGCAHIAQVSVDPIYRGQRLGQKLIDHLSDWAKTRGLGALTLTTYRDVPWNFPYYRRIGFRLIEPTPDLQRLIDREAAIGLDPAARVCLRREVS
ncbi:GNAT family N-acetyltransferase [Actinokineospora iranica]|nr:GNAT family N-acetyltransferase [Actinokineospora iranica]